MSVHPDQIDKYMDEIAAEQAIGVSLYCGRCGYNLRTLPVVGRCPECGSTYNARPAKLDGIFREEDVEVPITDALIFLVLGPPGYWLLIRMVTSYSPGKLFFGSLLGGFGTYFGIRAVRKAMRFMRYHQIARRIRQEEEYD
ncbi:MAG: hypothetical protein JSV78_00775 [Phycisphaerales bacterium]|nr:MAG: hypothetical protein JSV78_00775 [Phycisphaerales bacterium]